MSRPAAGCLLTLLVLCAPAPGGRAEEPAGTGAAAPVVVVAPLDLPPGYDAVADEVAGRVEPLLAEALREAGFTVAASTEFKRIWEEASSSVGGAYDPFTGEPIAERKRQADVKAFARMAEELKAAYVVEPHVVRRFPEFFGSKVVWDGVTEVVDERAGYWKALTFTTGAVEALSLGIVALDIAGSPVAAGIGGIELTQKIGFGKVKRSALEGRVGDPSRIRRAAAIALAPFLEKTRERQR